MLGLKLNHVRKRGQRCREYAESVEAQEHVLSSTTFLTSYQIIFLFSVLSFSFPSLDCRGTHNLHWLLPLFTKTLQQSPSVSLLIASYVYCDFLYSSFYVYGDFIKLVHKPSCSCTHLHYHDVIMTTVASQITSLTVVYSTVYLGADKRKHQSSASLAFVRGIHRDRWIPRTKGQ